MVKDGDPGGRRADGGAEGPGRWWRRGTGALFTSISKYVTEARAKGGEILVNPSEHQNLRQFKRQFLSKGQILNFPHESTGIEW